MFRASALVFAVMATPFRFQHFEVLTKPDGSPHLLGKGAMGLTYKAFDRNLLSLAVVKVIAPEHMGRPEARQRFLQEAQSMARIRHPNVADVFFYGDSPQGVFYAMEFCDGPSVQEYVEEHGPLKPEDALPLGLQASQALEAVEQNGLIHRDIKPSNIILVKDPQGHPRIKLIDFGLARDVLNNPLVSQIGFVGTPTFASPEQLLEQEHLDIRSDIYSLGVTLWFMLTGRPPFSGSQFEVMFHHVNTPPPRDRLPAMPEPAVALLLRMLGKSPDDRYPDSAALSAAFRQVIEACGYGAGAEAHLTLGHRETAGSVLGMSSFEILSEAESDLTGKTFRARDAHDGRVVALKYLHPSITGKPDLLGRIQRQALSLRNLEHPHLTGVLGFEKSDDGAKIIFEWVAGPSLLAVLKARGRLSLREAAPLLGQLAGALDFAASKGLSAVETDLHQILLTSPVFGEDQAEWPKLLRQPVETWGEVKVKVNPLRLSLAAGDYPTVTPPASGEEPGPLPGIYQQLAYRLLGGAGGSSQTRLGGGYVSIPTLGAEANDLLESFVAADGKPQNSSLATCVDLVKALCRAEGVPEPAIYQPPGEPEIDLNETRDATYQGSSAPGGRSTVSFATKGRLAPGSVPPPAGSSRPGSRWGSTTRRPGSQFATRGRHGSRFASAAGSISADYLMRLREIEAQRGAFDTESGSRVKKADALEAARLMLDEERKALAEAREAIIQQERERARRAEEERHKLEEERRKLEEKTNEVEARRREQERLEQEIRLRAQLEFQKFEEERRRREAELERQREEIERSLREREEKALLREQMTFKKLREERERLMALQRELERGDSPSLRQVEEALREQLAALENERQGLAAQQEELDRKLREQNEEIARLRERFDAAERELEARHQQLARAEAEAEARRNAEMETERARLAGERAQLERRHAELAAERQADTEAARALLLRQREENESALAKLAEREREFAREREAMEEQRARREAELAEQLANARRQLEAERAAMLEEAGHVKRAGLEELEREREALAAQRAQVAAREAELAAQVEAKNREIQEQLARREQELEAARAAVAADRERLEAEYQRLVGEFNQEKEQFSAEIEALRRREEEEHRQRMRERAEELARLEQAEQARLEALRRETAAEEARLREQREEVFAQERLIARMEQEASFQDQEVREQFEEEQKRLEAQRLEVEQKLLELQKAQKKRLVTILVGTVFGVTAASAAGFYIKGRILDPAKLKGQEAWVEFAKQREDTVNAQDWPAVLNWSVQTDEEFRKRSEEDPVIRKFYEEKRGLVLEDAKRAVEGILASLENGWEPPPPESAEFQKLRQNLTVVAEWDGIPAERLLTLAKLDLPWLTKRNNPGAALETYTKAVTKNPEFIPRLRRELEVTTQGLLDDFLEDHALENWQEIFRLLMLLPEPARQSAPRSFLLLYLLKEEEARAAAARAGNPSARTNNFKIALNAINAAAASPETRELFAQDPEWAKILRPEVDRVLDTLEPHREAVERLEPELRETAELWKTDRPYMMLAATVPLTQKALDFYEAAEKLTGNLEAKTRVACMYLDKATEMLRGGDTSAARPLIETHLPRLEEAAAQGQAEAMYRLADFLRLGIVTETNLDEAIAWARKAKDAGHPEADFCLGLCFLQKGERQPSDRSILKQAESALLAASERAGSLNSGAACYWLANTRNLLKDYPGMTEALEKGAGLENRDCLFYLGQCRMVGKPYFPAPNLTLGRDLVTRAARAGHAKALEFLKSNARVWRKSNLPADRDWIAKNADLLEN